MERKGNFKEYFAIVVLTTILGFFVWRWWPSLSHKAATPLRSILPPSSPIVLTDSTYRTVSQKPQGWFKTGQDADIVLSAIDFNDSGGPLLFNHPGGIASNGTNLILADRNNNRVLIWNTAPSSNQPPDIVLGQKDFHSIAPGGRLDQLNWPVCVATDGVRLIVCDTQNHRLLVWNKFPQENGQPADLILGGLGDVGANERGRIAWPWAAWTDGERLVLTSTVGAQVLIWNSFPTQSQQPADIAIRLPQFGTPRSIGSNGKVLAISDHNAKPSPEQHQQGTFFWKTFPTRENEPFDFFIPNPSGEPLPDDPNLAQGEVLWGMQFLPDGRFMALGSQLYLWDEFPRDKDDSADLVVGSRQSNQSTYRLESGDGSGSAIAAGKIYLSLSNGNKIVAFSDVPTHASTQPDIVIGSPDINTNTLETEFIISNPVPATDGESLFVISDFDGRFYVWQKIPDESGAHPDIMYRQLAGNDLALHNSTLAVAGGKNLYLWHTLPKNGEPPETSISNRLGSVNFQDIRGVAVDNRYFYLADREANAVYVWEGIPDVTADGTNDPVATLPINQPDKLASDGTFLAASCCQDQPGGGIALWRVSEISSHGSAAAAIKPAFNEFQLNLPGAALPYKNSLFVADGNNRVLIWDDTESALRGEKPEVILGQKNLTDTTQAIGRDSLFMPNALAFDGSFLWVGEVKFSERLLRFSVR